MKEEESLLKEIVSKDTTLKNILVEYVGNSLQPKDGNVTIEMIVEVLSKEFPDFLLAIAEENFIRGYQQAFADQEAVKDVLRKDKKNRKNKKDHVKL